MGKILAKELKLKFVEVLNMIDGFSYEEGNPFLITISGNMFYVFLKNISPAYFANLPDITRVQLPYSDHFNQIIKENVTFVILGYDTESDTFVGWNPERIKQRLNAKGNISLYSRKSLQEKVPPYEFSFGSLSNGEKIVLFRREMLPNFFSQIQGLFSTEDLSKDFEEFEQLEPEELPEVEDKIYEIKDQGLLEKIKPILQKDRVLEAVKICGEYYKDKYKAMKFRDWFNLVEDVYKRLNGFVAADVKPISVPQAPKKQVTAAAWGARCIPRISMRLKLDFVRHSQTVYSDSKGDSILICLVSKKYQIPRNHYWFGYTSKQASVFDGKGGYIAFGCESEANIVLIPYLEFAKLFPQMNKTVKEDYCYWHVHITETDGKYILELRGGNKVDVSQYLV